MYNANLFTDYFIQSINYNPFLLNTSMTEASVFSFNSEPPIQGAFNIGHRLSLLGLQNLTVLPENYVSQMLPNGGFLITLYGTVNYNLGTYGFLLNTSVKNIFITMIIEPWNGLYYLTNLMIKTKNNGTLFNNNLYNNDELACFYPGYYGSYGSYNQDAMDCSFP